MLANNEIVTESQFFRGFAMNIVNIVLSPVYWTMGKIIGSKVTAPTSEDVKMIHLGLVKVLQIN